MHSVEILVGFGAQGAQNGTRGVEMQELTRFERARIIGARALQIAMGAPVLIKVDGVTDPVEIAEIELMEEIIPITVRRR